MDTGRRHVPGAHAGCAALETILRQCPDRFEVGAKNLGDGDQCQLIRKGAPAGGALVRNQSYRGVEQATLQDSSP